MVVDDVWREQDLRPFLQGSRNCVRLVTTRIDSVLPDEAVRQKVDAMRGGEALSLLSRGLPQDQATRERAGLAGLAGRLGEWPLLLKIVNGFLRNRVTTNKPLPDAVGEANKRLDARGLTVFDPRDETERNKAAALTIDVSLDLLTQAERERFGELGVFPEDADIPIEVVARLWSASGGIEDFETDDLLGRLFDRSLRLERDLGEGFFRLHDTVRQLLRDRAEKERLIAQHKALIAALNGASEAADERTRRYFYRSFPHHLAETGEREKLDALLLDPAWLKAKLSTEAARLEGHTGAVQALCVLPNGRLASGSSDDTIRLWDLTMRTEAACLEGDAHSVYALCLLPDGRLASGCEDNTVRIWNLTTRTQTGRLEERTQAVRTLCVLSDGRLASGSWDCHIALWNVVTGENPTSVTAETEVEALCLLPDSKLAAGSQDNTIRLWDLESEVETARFAGHTDSVCALCALPDGRLASGAWDCSIRLWDVRAGLETKHEEGHTDSIETLCVLPNAQLASGSRDETIRLWDVATGAQRSVLRGHEGWVNYLLFSCCRTSGSHRAAITTQ